MDVCNRLEALLEVLDGRRLPDAYEFQAAVDPLCMAASDAVFMQGAMPVQERRRLCSMIAALGPRLAALDAKLQQAGGALAGGGGGATLLNEACVVLQVMARLGIEADLASVQAQQLGGAAALLLGSGRAQLRQRNRSGRPVLPAASAVQVAATQAVACLQVLDLLTCHSTPARRDAACMAFAVEMFSPAKMLPWLNAVSSVMLAMVEAGEEPGELLTPLGALGSICERLLSATQATGAAFSGLQAAVQADAPLRRQLVQLLLHVLWAAVPSVVPEDAAALARAQRRSTIANDWRFLAGCIAALLTNCLRPELERQLAANPRQLAAVQRQLAARLLAELPLAPPPGIAGGVWASTWMTAIYLTHACMAFMQHWQGRKQLAARDVAVLRVMGLLPRAATVLRVALTQPGLLEPRDAAEVATTWWRLFTLPSNFDFGTSAGPLATAVQVSCVLEAADAAARLLPFLHALSQQLRQAGLSAPFPGAEAWKHGQGSGPAPLAQVCLEFWAAVPELLKAAGSQLPEATESVQGRQQTAAGVAAGARGQRETEAARQLPGTREELARATAAARTHHLTSCRLLLWAATEASPQWMQEVAACSCLPAGSAINSADLAQLHRHFMVITYHLRNVVGDAGLDGGAPRRVLALRRRGAAFLAEWEASQVVLPMLHPNLDEADQKGLRSVVPCIVKTASGAAPAALQGERLELLLRAVRAAARHAQHEGDVEYAEELAMAAMGAPCVAAALLRGGAYRDLLAVPSPQLIRESPLRVGRVLFHVSAVLLWFHDQAPAFFSSAAELSARPPAGSNGGEGILSGGIQDEDGAACAAGSSGATGSSSSGGGGSSGSGNDATGASTQVLAELAAALDACRQQLEPSSSPEAVSLAWQILREQALPLAEQAAAQLLEGWELPAVQTVGRLGLAETAAARGCANLRCANLAGNSREAEGGKNQACASCRAVRYCCTACAKMAWKHGGHKSVCKELAARRQEQRQQQAERERPRQPVA